MGAETGSHPTDQAQLHGLGASRVDPERFGKYGLLVLDELAIETLASAVEAQGATNAPVDKQGERLRHALAAYMMRCQTGGEWEDK